MLRCAMAGVEAVEASTRHTFPRHTHEQFGIGLVYSGAQRSYSCRGMVEALPGDTITVNPGEVHDGASIGGDARSWRILYFDPALVADLIHDITEGRTSVCEFSHPVLKRTSLAERFHTLFSSVTAEIKGEAIQHEESLLAMLADVMRAHRDCSDERAAPDVIVRARRLIDDNPAAPVTLADLALESGLSRFQVLRGFAKATGLTPHAYLVQRRIQATRRLLAQGTPLAEAAAACGIADPIQMTRIFVRNYGVSPRQYADALA